MPRWVEIEDYDGPSRWEYRPPFATRERAERARGHFVARFGLALEVRPWFSEYAKGADGLPVEQYVVSGAARPVCREAASGHKHRFEDDDIAWGAITCGRCGVTIVEFARRWPALAEDELGVTPADVREWDRLVAENSWGGAALTAGGTEG